MLDCVIAGVSQDMNFEKNVTTTFLLLRLPDGRQLRAAIDDAAAAIVVGLSVAQNGQPTSTIEVDRSVPPVIAAPVDVWSDTNIETEAPAPLAQIEEEASPRIFGGQDGGDDEPAPEPSKPAVQGSNVQRLPNGKIIVPSRKVPMNAFGYPIVPGAGVDTNALTSQTNQDEDGVGSV